MLIAQVQNEFGAVFDIEPYQPESSTFQGGRKSHSKIMNENEFEEMLRIATVDGINAKVLLVQSDEVQESIQESKSPNRCFGKRAI